MSEKNREFFVSLIQGGNASHNKEEGCKILKKVDVFCYWIKEKCLSSDKRKVIFKSTKIKTDKKIIKFMAIDSFFSLVKFLFIHSNAFLGVLLMFYTKDINVPLGFVVHDIGFLGFELDAVYCFGLLLVFNSLFVFRFVVIDALIGLYKEINNRVGKFFLLIISIVILLIFSPDIIYSIFYIFCKENYLLGIYCISPFGLYLFLYFMCKKTKLYAHTLLLLGGSLLLAALLPDLDKSLLRVYGNVPPENSQYLFKGKKETSETIKSLIDVAELKKQETPFLDDKGERYVSNPQILKALMAAGDYMYFSEYGAVIRVKKDDIILLGTEEKRPSLPVPKKE